MTLKMTSVLVNSTTVQMLDEVLEVLYSLEYYSDLYPTDPSLMQLMEQVSKFNGHLRSALGMSNV